MDAHCRGHHLPSSDERNLYGRRSLGQWQNSYARVAPDPLVLSGMRSMPPAALLGLALLSACNSVREGPRGTTFRNVSIVDGTGSAARSGRVRMVGDTIVAVGDIESAPGDTIVDGHGLTIAPSFIDTHSHHTGGLLQSRDALAAVSQGITTVVGGPYDDSFDVNPDPPMSRG